ncbi:glycoside hydrolase family 68 protein [Rahnella sp. BCC 1045]|uniref:glycoside hydrolase family 68 protein n=1 Tax=Rahnella sp. BCC 1045 TaxID=2816251 RepID=UPI00353006D3
MKMTRPDGVYGFVSNEIFGPYVPLNGSALVLGNPPSQPFQTYSHSVMPIF